jgi:soluble lytic murein transglycosylase-like protein
MFRTALVALFLLLAPALSQAQSPRMQELIYEEAYAAGVPPRYVLAIARVSSQFDPHYHDHQGRIGVLAVRPELAAQVAPDTQRWLDYPPANVHAGVAALVQLKQQHGDWRRTLSVYRSGKPRASRDTRRWVNAVLRQAQSLPPAERWHPRRTELDDFGHTSQPRPIHWRERGWQPIHRFVGDK